MVMKSNSKTSLEYRQLSLLIRPYNGCIGFENDTAELKILFPLYRPQITTKDEERKSKQNRLLYQIHTSISSAMRGILDLVPCDWSSTLTALTGL